ncbi:MAG: Kelch repeat-containing protein [Gaiellaceae bacterium]
MSKFALTLLLVLVVACGSEPAADVAETSQPPAADFSSFAPGWSQLPAPPHRAACAVSVWTGRELFYWGGDDTCQEGTPREAGAAFDPTTATWRRLSPPPLAGRSSAAAVWADEEVLVWGGWSDRVRGDGAAYKPATDEWRLLPESPLSPRIPVAAVWTGREMLVWGDVSRAGESADGAAYEPATDSWHALSDAPFGLNFASAVWTGEEMIVFGALLDGNNHSSTEHAHGAAYDPEKDAWRVIAPYPLSPQASTIVWIGGEMIAWDYELHAGAYDPETDTWRALPDLPFDFYECSPEGALVGRFVLAWHCGQSAVLDLAAGQWRKLPRAPGPVAGEPVAAGEVVLFAGAWPGDGNTLTAFKPGPIGATAFVPHTDRDAERDYLPLTFPDGTSIVLSYPLELDLAGMSVEPSVSYLYRDDRPPRFELTFVYGPAEPRSDQVGFPAGSWTVLAALLDPGEADAIARSLSGAETSDGFPVIEALPPIALSDESGEGGGPRLTLGVQKDRWIELEPEPAGRGPDEISPDGTYASLCLGGAISARIYGDRAFVEAVYAGLELGQP